MIQPNRWKQRFENFEKSLIQLEDAAKMKSFSNLELAGFIQTFIISYELGWKTLKDLLEFEGHDANTSREVIRTAFEVKFLSKEDSEIWLLALESRNLLSHTYNEACANKAERLIRDTFLPMLRNTGNFLKTNDKWPF